MHSKIFRTFFAYLRTHLALIFSPCSPIGGHDTALLLTHLGSVYWLWDDQHGGCCCCCCISRWSRGWCRWWGRTTATVRPRGSAPRTVIQGAWGHSSSAPLVGPRFHAGLLQTAPYNKEKTTSLSTEREMIRLFCMLLKRRLFFDWTSRCSG